MAKLTITINPEGAAKVKVDGVRGASCKDLTRGIEKALGTVVSDQKTDDYYKTEVTKNANTNRA